ncbi:hypothetical protein RND81_12G040100 [Saponaria officinalis]|uniref:Leucine-rich repeat-containing N-terminal plant-type domain-containing protein n=1 Tax=Saponaria officinalis TaxID=3572 RepID=A0AAW1H2Z5_SAPOF
MKTLTTFILILLHVANADTGGDPFCNAEDQAVLLKIQDHFGGQDGRLSGWDPSLNCCTDWNFVGCDLDYDSHPGRVTSITVSRNWGLSGPLPIELGHLPFLNTLSFAAQPNITGPIPQSFGNLKYLQVLDLDSNQITGPIPVVLGRLKSLLQVNLSDNRLFGVIPNFSDKLTSFDVSSNSLCGAIPTVLNKFGLNAFKNNKCLCGAPLPTCKFN